jgi:hypothetical protein
MEKITNKGSAKEKKESKIDRRMKERQQNRDRWKDKSLS